MPVDKKVAAVAGGGILIAAIAFMSGGEAHAAEPVKKAPPLTDKQRAIALAVKFANAFKIPPSLILALMAVGGWRKAGQVANSRGGAWGYCFMTLATANDLTKRFPAQAKAYWPHFNGTSQSLLDPATNIALGAWQLHLQWEYFKHRWTVAALSYYSGAGRMNTILKASGGKLPTQLPADVARQKAAYDRVRAADTTVKKAIGLEGGTTGTTIGDAKTLALKLDTYDKCRQALGEAARILNQAYPIADKAPLMARMTTDIRAVLHRSIDDVNSWAQRVYKNLSNPPTMKERQEAALALIQAGQVLKSVDDTVNNGWSLLQDFEDAINRIIAGAVKVAVDAAKAVANELPWWVFPLGLAAGGIILLKK